MSRLGGENNYFKRAKCNENDCVTCVRGCMWFEEDTMCRYFVDVISYMIRTTVQCCERVGGRNRVG
jgi:hypothetical protein